MNYMKFEDKNVKEILELAKKISEILKDTTDPYTKVIISGSHIKFTTELLGIPTGKV